MVSEAFAEVVRERSACAPRALKIRPVAAALGSVAGRRIAAGYIAVTSTTYNGLAGLRAISKRTARRMWPRSSGSGLPHQKAGD
jgi:hypothetical protein